MSFAPERPRALIRAARGLAVVSLLLLAGVLPSSCKATPPTIYCVFESESLAGGRCLTECESRCNLETIAGCPAPDCIEGCENGAVGSGACLDAAYSYWRCLRLSAQPTVTCSDGTPVFTVPGETCSTEHAAMISRCPADAGTSRDGTASSSSDGSS
ncbi:MAG TPA: hypothetical protein VHU80_03135 [Polyangiaceae bacterium]|nr:hypothetical protein [Polyangiaceae bacterium]